MYFNAGNFLDCFGVRANVAGLVRLRGKRLNEAGAGAFKADAGVGLTGV